MLLTEHHLIYMLVISVLKTVKHYRKKDIEKYGSNPAPTCAEMSARATASPPAFSFHTAFLGRPILHNKALSNKNVRKYPLTSFPFSADGIQRSLIGWKRSGLKERPWKAKELQGDIKHHAFILLN